MIKVDIYFKTGLTLSGLFDEELNDYFGIKSTNLYKLRFVDGRIVCFRGEEVSAIVFGKET